MDNRVDQRFLDHLSAFITAHKKEEMERVLGLRTRHITVVLENIYQPQNASAVIRSCDCFGVQDLHVIERENRFRPNRAVTMGANKWVDVIKHPRHDTDNTRTCLEGLKHGGYQIAALTLRPDAISIQDLDIHPPTALCIGTEKEGLTELAHELADVYVQIPMSGFTQSFNLSVTAALCLYELTGRLRASDADWRLTVDETEALRLRWYRSVVPREGAHREYIMEQSQGEAESV